jgi:hypothetical protein
MLLFHACRSHRGATGQPTVIDHKPPAAGSPSGHPKDVLYERVYDPLTREWFAALESSKEVNDLVQAAPVRGLLATMLDLNALFHHLVDDVLAQPMVDAKEMIATTKEHQAHVLWVGHAAPTPGANDDLVLDSLSKKMKRNISLGVVEALICLQSAYEYGRQELGLSGQRLEDMLRRSRQLYASLAILHDDQEQVRLRQLAGITGFLKYPDTDYADALDGTVAIGPEHFHRAGTRDQPRLRFKSSPVPTPADDSPIKRCPAQRLRGTDGQPLNDGLWDLLLDVYRSAGQFD